MADTFAVANRFLALAKENDSTLTPMQLLKLVYIAHGWMLGLYGKTLICDDIEAWQYGPVIPTLYEGIRKFKSNPVKGPLNCNNSDLDKKESQVIDQVYEIYGGLTGGQLSSLTHAKGTPWAITTKELGHWGNISNDLIKIHYKDLYKKLSIKPVA